MPLKTLSKPLHKCVDESPSNIPIRTEHIPVTIEVETSLSTASMSFRAIERSPDRSRSPNKSICPDELPLSDEDAPYSDINPVVAAIAAARDLKRCESPEP